MPSFVRDKPKYALINAAAVSRNAGDGTHFNLRFVHRL
jgi:hypothetical protein